MRLKTMRLSITAMVLSVAVFSAATAGAQNSVDAAANSQVPTLSVSSNLVLVPALVKTKSGEVVFALTAEDFTLTDNGVPQSLRLEQDTDSRPLAVAVIVQTGGQGAFHLGDYRNLDGVLDAVIGNVPHRVAVVSFGSVPQLEQDFTANTDEAVKAIANLHEGNGGAAILDALAYGIHLLSVQPPDYRRAVVLFSEIVDGGSQTSFEDAIRAVDDTNTAIYSFGFSSTKAALKHQESELPRPGGTPYSDTPYAPGGCMSREPGADPDAHGKRSVQALDCASDLIPPIRLARMMFLAARDGIKRNVPESVAQLTGGEYFPFKDAATLNRHLVAISHDVPNYYVLSFRPQSPSPGFHALKLSLKDEKGLQVRARNAYWVDSEAVDKK